MTNPIMLSEPLQVAAANITFTAAEWSAKVAQVNIDAYFALLTGIIIGAVVGVASLYLGIWYKGRDK